MIEKAIKKIATGVAARKAIGIGARFLGRSASVVGWGMGAYSSVKTYKTYTKDDPYVKYITPLEKELEKWGGAISCIGREPYYLGDICSISRGGAINALGEKELFHMPNTRYPQSEEPNMEYHAPRSFSSDVKNILDKSFKRKEKEIEDSRMVKPDPAEAKQLIKRSLECLASVKKATFIEDFESKKERIIEKIESIERELEPNYKPEKDYTPIQEELSGVVDGMVDLEFEYKSRLNEWKSKQKRRRLKYAGVAALSFVVGSFSFKKKKI